MRPADGARVVTAALSRAGRTPPVRRLPVQRLPSSRTPTVTVVVACANHGRYLLECLESALAQPGVRVSVLIVDDASTDGSAELAALLAAGDSRITLLRNLVRQGFREADNAGLERATGDYVTLLRATDLLAPGALARSVALLEAHPTVGLVYGSPVEFVDDDLAWALAGTRERVRGWTLWRGADWIDAQRRRGAHGVRSPEVVLRTAVQQRAGGYDPGRPEDGDLQVWLRVAAISDVGRVNGCDQAFRRKPGAGA
jgi:glycosyltransferase involved in cell wall biosynthesis